MTENQNTLEAREAEQAKPLTDRQKSALSYIAGGYKGGIIAADSVLDLLKENDFAPSSRVGFLEAIIAEKSFEQGVAWQKLVQSKEKAK